MSTIANMAVMLSLDAQKFNAGLKSVTSKLEGFATGLIGTLGVARLAQGFAATVRELENIGDAAASAGVTVREYMAAVGGMNSEDTAATTMALNKMGKALAEIYAGGVEKAKELKELGLDPASLLGQGSFEALRSVAKAISQAKTESEKLAIAYAVFGKSATEVMTVIEKIAALSGQIEGKFAGLGPDDIRRMEEAEKKLTEIENVVKNIRNQAVMGFAGMFEGLGAAFGGNRGIDEWLAKGRNKPDPDDPWAMRPGENAAQAQERLLGQWGRDIGNAHKDELKKEAAALAEKAAKAVKDFVDELEVKLKTIGQTNEFAKLEELKQKFKLDDAAMAPLKAKVIELRDLEKAEKARKEYVANFGKRYSTMADFQQVLGKMVREKAGAFVEPFTRTSPTLQRGSAEEASFRAQFEQRREGVKTLESQLIDVFKQAAASEKQQATELQKIGKMLQDKFPIFKMAAMGQ